MKYELKGISNTLAIDEDNHIIIDDCKRLDAHQVLHVFFQKATPTKKGCIIILSDQYKDYKVEYVFSTYSDQNKIAQQIVESIDYDQSHLLGYQYAKYYGGNPHMTKTGKVNVVLLKERLVITNGVEIFEINYDNIIDLKYEVDETYKMSDDSYLFNYLIYGIALGSIITATEQKIKKVQGGKLTIKSQGNQEMTIFSSNMNELYTVLYHLAHLDELNTQKGQSLYKVECLKLDGTENDAIQLEKLLNDYLTKGFDLKNLITREKDVLIIFKK